MSQGTIIVTGASRGIGAAIAQDLTGRGFQVAGLSRSGNCASGAGYACDMNDDAAIMRCFGEIAAKGPIVGLVNNAGRYQTGRSSTLSTADYEATMRTNATSVFVAAREVYPHMKAAGGGLIVNISSFFARLGVSQHLAYCASKGAIEAMTRCLAVEWARDKIRVMAIAPGYIHTDFNKAYFESEVGQSMLKSRVPVRRVGEPGEVGVADQLGGGPVDRVGHPARDAEPGRVGLGELEALLVGGAGAVALWALPAGEFKARMDAASPDGSAATNFYNGLTTTVTNDLGQVETTVKNARGEIVSVTDANLKTTTFTYDPFGNRTSMQNSGCPVVILWLSTPLTRVPRRR